MMGHKREKREKQDIGETYANYWIRQHQAEMCRYQPIIRENSMVTLRTKQIPDKAFIREGSLMNLKSSPRKNNEFNFARDLALSQEPTFIRDQTLTRENPFLRDQSSYYDRHASCHSSEIIMDDRSTAGDSMVRDTSNHTGNTHLPEKAHKLFKRWDSHKDKISIPQRKYTILPQIGNPRFVNVQNTSHQFVNQLDYSRDSFEKEADFFADYNKNACYEEVRSIRGVPLPPLSSMLPRLKLNFLHQTEENISEETSRCFTNSMTLSDMATSSLDQYSDENYTITCCSSEDTESVTKENVVIKYKENKTESRSGCDIENQNDNIEGEETVSEKKENDDDYDDDEYTSNDSETDEDQTRVLNSNKILNTNKSDGDKELKYNYTTKAANVTSNKHANSKGDKNITKHVQ